MKKEIKVIYTEFINSEYKYFVNRKRNKLYYVAIKNGIKYPADIYPKIDKIFLKYTLNVLGEE